MAETPDQTQPVESIYKTEASATSSLVAGTGNVIDENIAAAERLQMERTIQGLPGGVVIPVEMLAQMNKSSDGMSGLAVKQLVNDIEVQADKLEDLEGAKKSQTEAESKQKADADAAAAAATAEAEATAKAKALEAEAEAARAAAEQQAYDAYKAAMAGDLYAAQDPTSTKGTWQSDLAGLMVLDGLIVGSAGAAGAAALSGDAQQPATGTATTADGAAVAGTTPTTTSPDGTTVAASGTTTADGTAPAAGTAPVGDTALAAGTSQTGTTVTADGTTPASGVTPSVETSPSTGTAPSTSTAASLDSIPGFSGNAQLDALIKSVMAGVNEWSMTKEWSNATGADYFVSLDNGLTGVAAPTKSIGQQAALG